MMMYVTNEIKFRFLTKNNYVWMSISRINY